MDSHDVFLGYILLIYIYIYHWYSQTIRRATQIPSDLHLGRQGLDFLALKLSRDREVKGTIKDASYIIWNPMKSHEITWNSMKSHEITWNHMKPHEIRNDLGGNGGMFSIPWRYLCPVWVFNAFSEGIRALDRSLAQRFFLEFGGFSWIWAEFPWNLLEHFNHL